MSLKPGEERTPMEKLAGIKIELITLKPRLTEVYQENIEQCIKWCRELEEHLTIIDKEDDDES